MFFKQKPKRNVIVTKPDARTRFQRDSFRKKLTAASQYKRPVPGSVRHTMRQVATWRQFFSWWTVLVFALVLLLYVFFFSPWLVLSDVRVVGLADEEKVIVTSSVNDFLRVRPWYTFSRHAITLPVKAIHAAVANMPTVAQVDSVVYNWRSGELVITVEPALPRFVLTHHNTAYVVYESGRIAPVPQTLDPGKLQVLALPEAASFDVSNQNMLLTQSTAAVLSALRRDLLALYSPAAVSWYIEPIDFKPVTNVSTLTAATELATATLALPTVTPEVLPVSHDITLPITAAVIEARVTGEGNLGYRLIFDTQRDAAAVTAELQQLLTNLGPERLHQLAYIDLRIEHKAFVCLRGTPCAVNDK